MRCYSLALLLRCDSWNCLMSSGDNSGRSIFKVSLFRANDNCNAEKCTRAFHIKSSIKLVGTNSSGVVH